MRSIICGALSALFISSAASALELESLWTLEGFSNPESVVLGPDGETLYVSNVAGDGESANGEGFISRVSLTGEMLERRWVTGLNAPKGIDTDGEHIFVSDINSLVQINLADGQIISRSPIEDAIFLNDVAVAPDGGILVSDSGGSRVYRVTGGRAEIYAQGEWLRGVNGLLFEGNELLVSTMGTSGLFAFDATTGNSRQIAENLGEGDGIAVLGEGRYLVSEWPGRLFLVSEGADPEVLLDTRDEEIYLNDFILMGDILLVPNWEPSTLRAYRNVH